MVPTAQHVLQWQGHSLHYRVYGQGSKRLLCFHGFGLDGSSFEAMPEVLPGYTLYSFDLYFHGQSRWASRETPLYKSDWQQIMDAFLTREGIDRFSLMAYSLGGKFALATLESHASSIDQLWLIAPDGIRTHPLYSLATYPIWLRKFFRSLVTRPGRFYFLSTVADKLRLVHHGILRFAESQMNTRSKRARVYFSWVVFRLLKFNMEEIATLIKVHSIPLTIFIGKYDRIITAANMRKLLRYLPGQSIIELPSGHNQLISFVVKYFDTHKV
jgi:pimeloyl-ACP methyl ester carboxylesterase